MIVNREPGCHRPLPRPLFTEDFSAEQLAGGPAPEIIAPLFTADDIAEARTAGWIDGRDTALAEAELTNGEAMKCLARSITHQIGDIQQAARQQTETNAEAIAYLLLDILASLLPDLCASHGQPEARALSKAVLSGLAQEPTVTVWVNPALARHLASEIDALEVDVNCRPEVIPNQTVDRGDVRITWTNGTAVRDFKSMWRHVAAVLATLGLQCDKLNAELQDAA